MAKGKIVAKKDIPEEVKAKWTLPQKWADCSDEQKNMVTEMNFRFSFLSGLTEPDTWGTKVKMWCNPMVHIMNASGWTDAGMNRATRVIRNVITGFIHDRIEISSVATVYKRTCNLLSREQFVPGDFPELSYTEFVEMMKKEMSNDDDDYHSKLLAHQADLYSRAQKTIDSLDGDSLDEKMDSFESMLYGDDDE